MEKNKTKREWIETTGGPLILSNVSTLETWLGVESEDYNRACSTDDYFERLERVEGSVFVLGDEPLRTTVFLERPGLPILVRWKWAPSENAIMEQLQEQGTSLFLDPEEKAFLEKNDDMVLFDSSVSRPADETDHLLELSIPNSAYEVRTKVWEPNPEVALLLHGFFPLP